MAKIVFTHIVESVSGKICKRDSTYIACNKKTGKMYTAGTHSVNNPNTEKQQASRDNFTNRTKIASEWWKANKPTADNALGTDAYQQVMRAYKAQRHIGNPYCFLRSLVTADLKVVLSDKDLTGGAAVPGGSAGSGGSQQPGAGDGDVEA